MTEEEQAQLEALRPKDADSLDLGELLQETADGLVKDRKTELSNKLKKLFYKIDNLHAQRRRQKSDLKKTEDKLSKALNLAAKIKAGDWSVIGQLDKLDDDKKDNT